MGVERGPLPVTYSGDDKVDPTFELCYGATLEVRTGAVVEDALAPSMSTSAWFEAELLKKAVEQ